jgi:hypothetical protein
MTDEKKLPVRNLERISERKFQSYEAASMTKTMLTTQPMSDSTKELVAQLAKAKIFKRNDGTFDLVFYKKIQKEPKKLLKIDVGSLEPTKETEKFIEKVKHGLKSKDRRKRDRKGA